MISREPENAKTLKDPLTAIIVISTAFGITLCLVTLITIAVLVLMKRKSRAASENATTEERNEVYGAYYFPGTDERIDEMTVEVSDNNIYYSE